MNKQEIYESLCFVQTPSMMQINPFDETEKISSSQVLKSSLAQFSQNLSYFERQGKKIVANKKYQSNQKLYTTTSSALRRSEDFQTRPQSFAGQRLYRPKSGKKTIKQNKINTSASFFRSEYTTNAPLITIKKMQPVRNQILDMKRLQVTEQRSKRLLSLNVLSKNKKLAMSSRLYAPTQKQTQQPSLKQTKSQVKTKHVSKFSQSFIKSRKFRPIQFSINRRTSQQYQNNIKKTMNILNRCHDILTTISLKE